MPPTCPANTLLAPRPMCSPRLDITGSAELSNCEEGLGFYRIFYLAHIGYEVFSLVEENFCIFRDDDSVAAEVWELSSIFTWRGMPLGGVGANGYPGERPGLTASSRARATLARR